MDLPLPILTYTDFDPRGLERAYAKSSGGLGARGFPRGSGKEASPRHLR